MYPLDLPEPPYDRDTRLLCGPAVGDLDQGDVVNGWTMYLGARDELLRLHLRDPTPVHLTLTLPAPRTAERAFWSHVIGCPAELVIPENEGQAPKWWADYMLDQRAEEAMARRGGVNPRDENAVWRDRSSP